MISCRNCSLELRKSNAFFFFAKLWLKKRKVIGRGDRRTHPGPERATERGHTGADLCLALCIPFVLRMALQKYVNSTISATLSKFPVKAIEEDMNKGAEIASQLYLPRANSEPLDMSPELLTM